MTGVDSSHEQWLVQIDAELDGELSLVERAALAKHLATCAHCAGARASQLEVRVALARSAGNPHAFVVPRPSIRAGTLALWVALALATGLSRDGLRTAAGAGRAGAQHSRSRVGLSSFTSVILVLSALQAPGTRLTYRIRVIEPAAVARASSRAARSAAHSNSDMRLTLRTDSAEVEALFQVTPLGDTVTLGGEFYTRRRVGRSRRGLPLWEEDTYRRMVRFAWSDTARIYPFGPGKGGRRGGPRALWVELILEREFCGRGRHGPRKVSICSTRRRLSPGSGRAPPARAGDPEPGARDTAARRGAST